MIRQATAEDIPEIRLLMESVSGFWQPHWSNSTVATATAGELAFLFEEDSRILGLICAHDLGFRAYLSELIVAPGSRNRGIGRALLHRVPDAIPSYRAFGWEPPEAVLLRKRISPITMRHNPDGSPLNVCS